jgi:hypothetical protein
MRGWENPFGCKIGMELGIWVAMTIRTRDGVGMFFHSDLIRNFKADRNRRLFSKS